MKQKTKRIMSAMLVLCMTAALMISSVTEAQAASKYKKSISKTVKIQEETTGYPTVLTFNMQKAGTVTITFSCAVDENIYSEASISTSGETVSVKSGVNNRPALANQKGYNKVTMKVKFKKGEQTVSIMGNPYTYKLKLAAKKNVLKFKSLEALVTEDVG